MGAEWNMQKVGHYLQMEAKNVSDEDRDTFARSAYNRYYYSVFLTVRDLIRTLKPDVTSLPHKSYPDLLKNTIFKELNGALKIARRNDDSVLVGKIEKAKNAARNLADQLEKANGVRITADYYPESYVSFENVDRFSLRGITITEAHNWSQLATSYCGIIENAWSQVYGT